MSNAGNAPSQNPADLGTLAGALRSTFRKLIQGQLDGMLPCTVVAVTADRDWVTVQPTVQVLGTDNTLTPRPQYARIPVLTIGAGNFVMSFPIAPGDSGWIWAADRDISLYLQTGQSSGPNTNRQHSFSDGVFLPDKARLWTLAAGDAASAVWQSLDGTVKITQGASEIALVHPTKVALTTPLMALSGALEAVKGLGAFGVDPPTSQPAVTGALSAVTDSNAKAVLTSIIGVLVGAGLASNGTT